MNPIRRRRIWIVSLVVIAVCGATALALAALEQNLQHFYSPSDVVAGMAPKARNFRLGGLVEEGSVKRFGEGLQVRFVVTDRFRTTPVEFEGILPDLFREGQSVVATGALRGDGTFAAHEVLAKHDENYMPKEVADAIARAKAQDAASGGKR
ncbi:MAG TPA: cytochrome c maturation protein CcmE [Candidatus Saccharimonadia bacterium]|nr:cytochrome c maturation protein CcmE [Candidatus Saccharimonadia bacterium]